MIEEAEWSTLSFEKRQAMLSLAVMTASAEVMNSLWSGAVAGEPKSWVVSDSLRLDERGWHDTCAVIERAWNELNAIAAQSDARLEQSGEESRTYVCNLQAFPRTSTARERAEAPHRGIPFDI